MQFTIMSVHGKEAEEAHGNKLSMIAALHAELCTESLCSYYYPRIGPHCLWQNQHPTFTSQEIARIPQFAPDDSPRYLLRLQSDDKSNKWSRRYYDQIIRVDNQRIQFEEVGSSEGFFEDEGEAEDGQSEGVRPGENDLDEHIVVYQNVLSAALTLSQIGTLKSSSFSNDKRK